MKQLQVSLTDDLNDFVETSVASGKYASDSEVIREGLRQLVLQQSDAAKLKWLQEAYRIGLESGDAGELDFEALKAEGVRVSSSALQNNPRNAIFATGEKTFSTSGSISRHPITTAPIACLIVSKHVASSSRDFLAWVRGDLTSSQERAHSLLNVGSRSTGSTNTVHE